MEQRAKKITQEQTEQVISLRGKMKAQDIADTVGITYNQVNEVFKRLKMTNKQNPIFDFTPLQEQLLLSGKLGDGNYKPNGKFNYYYRENHAEDELGYLEWKMNVFGKNIINNQGLYKIKQAGFNVQQPYGYSTRTSPSFIEYAKMSYHDAILKLNQYGLILFILDDGWFSKHSKLGNFCVSGGVIEHNDLLLLCEQFEKFNIHGVHIVGNKKEDLSIPSENNEYIFKTITEIIPEETDIIQKKFKHMYETNQIETN